MRRGARSGFSATATNGTETHRFQMHAVVFTPPGGACRARSRIPFRVRRIVHRNRGAQATVRRAIAVRLALLFACGAASTVAAADLGEDDPLHCWWRTTVSAVRIGEPFSVILTCAAAE